MRVLRLAFSGRSGAGKDSVAQAAFALLGLHPVRLSFGGHVVAEAEHACLVARASGAGHLSEVQDRLYIARKDARELVERVAAGQDAGSRALLQWWGTDVRRAAHSRYWLDRLADSVGALAPDAAAYVADCRFPDELDLVSSLGFTTVHVSAPQHLRHVRRAMRDGTLDHPDGHVTETSVTCSTRHDLVVDNSSSIRDTAAALVAALDLDAGGFGVPVLTTQGVTSC